MDSALTAPPDDGYRLTYGGLDYLALHAHTKQSTLYSLGAQIGVGKESDIHACAAPSGARLALKIHRLGRVSFRSVKANRDYLRHRAGTGSWTYLSRLAATKEHAFLRALHAAGFAVPAPRAHNRHTLVMELVDGAPLRQVRAVPDPAGLYAELMEMVLRLARFGLIHGDFNEFNVLIKEEVVEQVPRETNAEDGVMDGLEKREDATDPTATSEDKAGKTTASQVKLIPILIDFPQMVSISHPDAARYFDRDVNCIKRFFSRRFGFTSDAPGPFFEDVRRLVGKKGAKRLDVEVEASGFSRKMAKELESYMREVGADGEIRAEDSDIDDEGSDGGEFEEEGEDDAEEATEGDSDYQRKSQSKDTRGFDVTTSPSDSVEANSNSTADSLRLRPVQMELLSMQH